MISKLRSSRHHDWKLQSSNLHTFGRSQYLLLDSLRLIWQAQWDYEPLIYELYWKPKARWRIDPYITIPEATTPPKTNRGIGSVTSATSNIHIRKLRPNPPIPTGRFLPLPLFYHFHNNCLSLDNWLLGCIIRVLGCSVNQDR